ncbi:DUF4097 family beta strand repeat protein [Facklamia sp. DSM 111018]|uniref:DUF4097 family beta strand repeat protein n=1 Tax=Facklamia lactis TaxID=2749967 RepID=A0ABS0LUV4_9LACT|nr:DUF4097 family beta strand repeat-containing protein [Facklamia lactis]MBG9981283.1 DUF4097 family beta strand repeat protein [Facklamia lactis]MBG9987240.1 DUF4097 family beta strand repeat protein [Facklamia lactis]
MKKYKHLFCFLMTLLVFSLSSNSSEIIATNETINDPIHTISADLAIFPLEISSSSQKEIQIDIPELPQKVKEKIEINYTIEDGILTLTSSPIKNLISFDSFNLFNTKSQPIRITLPQNFVLKNLTVHSNLDSVSLTDIKIQEATIHLDMGELSLTNSEFENLTANLNMGNLKAKQLTAKGSDIQLDMGNFTGTATLIGQHNLDVSMGNIELDLLQKKSLTTVNSDVSLGSFKTDETLDAQSSIITEDPSTITLEVDMGNVTLNFSK